MSKVLAAVVQLTSRENPPSNMARVTDLVGQAADRGAKLICLPENFAYLGKDSEKFQYAETLDDARPGPILTALMDAAQRHSVWIIGGGMPERTDAPNRVYNACVAVNGDGKLAAVYRKIHLFDVDIPHGAQFRESDTVVPGTQPVLVETPWGKLGLTVCYDLRFPELYRRLAAEGATMVVVPAAFTLHTGKDHWHVLLRSRAIENQVYVLAPAQYGRHNERRTTYGHALVADPWGTVVAEMGDREGTAVAELDFDFLARTRREMPCLGHRRI